MATNDRHDLAMFIDFENIALGLRGRADQAFDVKKVLERLLEKGKIVVKRAYADWSRFGAYTRAFHENAIELIEIPKTGVVGKNSADIRLCVDAMDLCSAKEHIDTFVILSGDSDFSPLVSKLKENGKRVIGIGLRGSTSNLLVSNCDEFIFYETLEPQEELPPPVSAGQPRDKTGLMTLVTGTIAALIREGRDPIQASLVKDTIRRKQPSFNESDYGFRSFTGLLENAQAQGIIILREDPRSGTYFVSLAKTAAPPAPAAAVPRRRERPAPRGRERHAPRAPAPAGKAATAPPEAAAPVPPVEKARAPEPYAVPAPAAAPVAITPAQTAAAAPPAPATQASPEDAAQVPPAATPSEAATPARPPARAPRRRTHYRKTTPRRRGEAKKSSGAGGGS